MSVTPASLPLGSLSGAAKLGLILGGTAAVGLVGYALFGSSSAAASPAKGGSASASSGSSSSSGGPVALPGKGSAQQTWTQTTTLTQGATYRASADVADALASLGFTVYTDHDKMPIDWPSTDLGPNRWRVEGIWTGATTTLAQLWTSLFPGKAVPSDVQLWEHNVAVVAAGGGASAWQPTTTLTQGARIRGSLALKTDLSALGFQLWDEYDTLPADWPAEDTGPNRWRIEGPWTAATTTYQPGTIVQALEAAGVPSALAVQVADDALFWIEGV